LPTLHVRNVPDDLYERIRTRAQVQGRSITAEVVYLLQTALVDDRQDQAAILQRIQRRRFFRPATLNIPDSTTLLRQDRSR
jgi:plasmid stability protein